VVLIFGVFVFALCACSRGKISLTFSGAPQSSPYAKDCFEAVLGPDGPLLSPSIPYPDLKVSNFTFGAFAYLLV